MYSTKMSAPPSTDAAAPMFSGVPDGILRRYEVLEEVGRGGMGVVYRARHKVLGKEVALKITLPGAPVERFLREAMILAKIQSPYVVAVHDFEVLDPGMPMMVMEWIEGTDLGRLFKAHGGPMAEDEVLGWMEQTCAGMLAAAAEGVIHRDLKPSNILIDARRHARVADFGLAREATLRGDLSRSTDFVGTPYYTAPEQAEDPRRVDTRSDIYSYGAAFYHLLTGLPPFDGETAFTIMFKHKTEPLVPPRDLNPRLSASSASLIERCLAKNPDDRFQSFGEILRRLRPTGSSLYGLSWKEVEMLEILWQFRRARRGNGTSGPDECFTFRGGQTVRLARASHGEIREQPTMESLIEVGAGDMGIRAAVERVTQAMLHAESRGTTKLTIRIHALTGRAGDDYVEQVFRVTARRLQRDHHALAEVILVI